MTNNLITLKQIRYLHPWSERWNQLLKSLGNPKDMSLTVSIGDIAKSNGANDALWCCQCIDDRRFAVSLILPSVKRAAVHTSDQRVHDCISTIEKWLAGDDTVDLNAARDAALAAANATSDAASAAASATWAVAKAASDTATDAAAWAAAWAAWDVAKDAASDVEKQKQMEDIIAISPLHALK